MQDIYEIRQSKLFLLLLQTTVYIENFEEFLQKNIKADCFANSKPNKKRKKITFEEEENVFYEDLELDSPMKKSRIDDSEDKDKLAAIVCNIIEWLENRFKYCCKVLTADL